MAGKIRKKRTRWGGGDDKKKRLPEVNREKKGNHRSGAKRDQDYAGADAIGFVGVGGGGGVCFWGGLWGFFYMETTSSKTEDNRFMPALI